MAGASWLPPLLGTITGAGGLLKGGGGLLLKWGGLLLKGGGGCCESQVSSYRA